jgi:SAM-dependent methyltransferase
MTGTHVDDLNRATWSAPAMLDLFAAREGPIDAAEAAILQRLAPEVRGEPILDIGVGGGRTVPLLRAISEDYVGIDYLEELVVRARDRFPDARIEHLDARDLSAFEDRSFALVVFSTNGIDGISHEDRGTTLAEVHRVLRPGGRFFYSTHNLAHSIAGAPPWNRWWFVCRPRVALGRAIKLPRTIRAYRKASPLVARGDGWATLVDPAYDFGLLTHFVTPQEALRELETTGFEPGAEIYDPTGGRFGPHGFTASAFWFHVVARRPRPPEPAA